MREGGALARDRTKDAARGLVEAGLIGMIDPTAGAVTGVQRVLSALGRTSPTTAQRFETQVAALQAELKGLGLGDAAVDGARDLIGARPDDLRLLLRVGEDAGAAAKEALRQRAARLAPGYSEKDRAQIVQVLRAYFLCLTQDEGLGEAIQREILDNQAALLGEMADLRGLLSWMAARDGERALESREQRLGVSHEAASDYLNARYEIAPVVGREALLRNLSEWGDRPEQLLVRLLHAGGGEGKTRLALTAARQARRAGWRAGFLRGEASAAAIDALCESAERLFVILDYTEGKGGLIRTFLSAAQRAANADPRRTIRFLILARNADYWWEQQIREGEGVAGLLNGAEVSALPPAAQDETARRDLFDQAVAAYRAVLPAAWMTEGAPPASPDLSGGRYGSTLLLNIAAMAVARGDPAPEPEDCLAYALRRDEEYWTRRLKAEAAPLDIEALRTFVALATLLAGAAPGGDGVEAAPLVARARAATDLLPDALHPPDAARLLADLYPGTAEETVDALRPDPVGEWLAGAVLCGPARCREALLTLLAEDAWSDAQRKSAAIVLLRSAMQRADAPAMIEALAGFVAVWPERHAPAMIEALAGFVAVWPERHAPALVAGALESAVRPLEALQQARRLSLDGMMRLAEAQPPYDLRLLTLTAALLQDIVDGLRRDRAESDGAERVTANLATGLNNLANALSNLGRREEALAAIEEAVALTRDLTAARPDAFRPDLAGSLNNLSNRLSDLGRREEALAAIEEAVALRRALAATRPDAFQPDLAMSLNNLSGELSALGRREEALAAIDEAAALYRALAAARPDAFRPDLAASLNNLSNRLSDLGRREEALAAGEEAAALYRALAAARPDAFRPDLAGSLNNQSAHLSALGWREEALAAIEEAVALTRALAAARPDAFRPDLARSLNNQSNRLSDLGRREEALAAIEEAAALYRALAAARPDAFRPDLARSLSVLGDRLGDLARWDEAVAAHREAVATLAPAFFALPAAFAGAMATYARDYMTACKQAGAAPDEALLAPIAEALQGLGQAGGDAAG